MAMNGTIFAKSINSRSDLVYQALNSLLKVTKIHSFSVVCPHLLKCWGEKKMQKIIVIASSVCFYFVAKPSCQPEIHVSLLKHFVKSLCLLSQVQPFNSYHRRKHQVSVFGGLPAEEASKIITAMDVEDPAYSPPGVPRWAEDSHLDSEMMLSSCCTQFTHSEWESSCTAFTL